MKYTVLYNPLADSGKGTENTKRLYELMPDDELTMIDMTTLDGYEELLAGMDRDTGIIISGGDGTLNRFINEAWGLYDDLDIYYYAAGTGNDFIKDIGSAPDQRPVRINELINNLPEVYINGSPRRFINNVGFGIDGYCTEEGDRQREMGKSNINYTAIAIRGMIGEFKPVNARITVDGISRDYNKVWLAPTMKGRYYGGGMMPTPAQDRQSPDHSISVMVMYGSGRFKTLMVFPSIFKGEHVGHREMCEIRQGSRIHVEFDSPCSLQIDGETVSDVLEYEAIA